MERKTKIHADNGTHDLRITRTFDLPVALLFKAHVTPDIFEQWMSHDYGTTKVLKLEAQKHGSYQFETTDANGNVMFRAHGVIHELVPNQKITRTFEMDNAPFGAQLEFLEFEPLTENTCRLSMHIVYKSVSLRDQMLQLPFEHGLNMAHNRLQNIVQYLK
jgi:uncharacterized protein YndB with AHSA1/START domain